MGELVKVEVSKLEGEALDIAVEKALGGVREGHRVDFPSGYWCVGLYRPSTEWQQGGPLIEEYVTALNQSDYGGWWAHSGDHVGEALMPLIAAMRAIVTSKLGDTVEMPKELVT
ncbi:phage protein NinX family protein [Vreelandella venusta]|uniref:phage protein NinX family protein n=1 Tax=Vreelandella venusta TaxID=44935 RepID=UPI0018DAC71A|nr:phage protein NinX family protein [Halomonas venusta]QPI62400.1 DUF2591 family protein [Halomonas venusta]